MKHRKADRGFAALSARAASQVVQLLQDEGLVQVAMNESHVTTTARFVNITPPPSQLAPCGHRQSWNVVFQPLTPESSRCGALCGSVGSDSHGTSHDAGQACWTASSEHRPRDCSLSQLGGRRSRAATPCASSCVTSSRRAAGSRSKHLIWPTACSASSGRTSRRLTPATGFT